MEEIALDQYLEFHCVGGDCPYTCCGGGWNIDVDEKTDRFYQSCEGEFGEYLNKNIIRREGQPSLMRLRPDGHCALQDIHGLCSIQIAYGADKLCDVCRLYPRAVRRHNGVNVHYMTPSCPEVARELLERRQPLHVLRNNVGKSEKLQEADEVRRRTLHAAIRVLQDREITVAQRQRLFLLLNQAVQNALDANEPRTAQKVLSVFSMPEEYRKLSPDGGVQADAISKIRLLQLLGALFEDERRGSQLPTIFRRAVDYLQDPTADLDAFAAYLGQVNEKRRQREMENLLLGLLPAKYLGDFAGGDLYRQAVYVLLQAQLYRIFSAVGYAGGVAEEDKTRGPLVVSYISRYFDHARGDFLEKLDRLMTDTELSDMGFLFRLIG